MTDQLVIARKKIPSVFEVDRGVEAGGVMQFGVNRAELAREVGPYIDKIANGANPADLPVEEATKFKLVINMKTAKAQGLTISSLILARADEVIE